MPPPHTRTYRELSRESYGFQRQSAARGVARTGQTCPPQGTGRLVHAGFVYNDAAQPVGGRFDGRVRREPEVRPTVQPPARLPSALAPRVLAAGALLFVFLIGVNGLGDGFRLLGQDFIESFFAATSNPFIGLIVGLLATTVVQSSSVTTAMVVGLVAAPENPLPLANAIPMIMGANIGTTVTATIVSLAHAGRSDEFERAFPIAICHDLFNYLAVLILLPIEILTGFLGRTASFLAGALGQVGGVDYESPLSRALDAGIAPVKIGRAHV